MDGILFQIGQTRKSVSDTNRCAISTIHNVYAVYCVLTATIYIVIYCYMYYPILPERLQWNVVIKIQELPHLWH